MGRLIPFFFQIINHLAKFYQNRPRIFEVIDIETHIKKERQTHTPYRLMKKYLMENKAFGPGH